MTIAPQFTERAEQLRWQHQEFLATLTRIEVRLRIPDADVRNPFRDEFVPAENPGARTQRGELAAKKSSSETNVSLLLWKLDATLWAQRICTGLGESIGSHPATAASASFSLPRALAASGVGPQNALVL